MADPGDDAELTRVLAVAARLRHIVGEGAVVVGGVAQIYWTRVPYYATDLDVCAELGPDAERRLREAGFERDGRHWWSEVDGVAVEFPESRADGDPRLFQEVGGALIIGVSDLYLDRLRQSTVNENPHSSEQRSLLAVATECMDIIDWPYVRRRLAREPEHLRATMRRNNQRVRRVAMAARRQ